MAMDAEQIAKFNALLNVNITDIEDLPDFATFPVGTYRLKGSSAKIDQEGGSLGHVLELVELVSPAEGVDPELYAKLEAGTLTSVKYFGAFGIQKWKQAWGQSAAAAGATNIAEWVDQFGNLEFIVTLGVRTDKEDKTKKYQDVVLAVLA